MNTISQGHLLQFDDYGNFNYRFAELAYGIRLDIAIFWRRHETSN